MDARWMDTGLTLSARAREWALRSRPGMRFVDAGDRTHRPTPPDVVKALVPEVQVEVIPTAGHSPELEHPDRLLALLGD